jgi:hypothetical protein
MYIDIYFNFWFCCVVRSNFRHGSPKFILVLHPYWRYYTRKLLTAHQVRGKNALFSYYQGIIYIYIYIKSKKRKRAGEKKKDVWVKS